MKEVQSGFFSSTFEGIVEEGEVVHADAIVEKLQFNNIGSYDFLGDVLRLLGDSHGKLDFEKVNFMMESLGYEQLYPSDQKFITDHMDINNDGWLTLPDIKAALTLLSNTSPNN